MMTVIALIVELFKAYKMVSPVLLAIGSGLGMIVTKGLGWGIPELFQALMFIFGGALLADLRGALTRLESLMPGSSSSTLTPAPAPAANTDQPAKAS